MITIGYVVSMAAYNAEMNRRLFAAAGRLTDAERRMDRSAFWRSIHGTLSHLLWADTMWMSRFDGWVAPTRTLSESDQEHPVFREMQDARIEADRRLDLWAETLHVDWLGQDQVWWSGAAKREAKAPRTMLMMHLFNHQTHHRGQVHAMLTAAGQTTGGTDLWLILSP